MSILLSLLRETKATVYLMVSLSLLQITSAMHIMLVHMHKIPPSYHLHFLDHPFFSFLVLIISILSKDLLGL